jgi:hypothetical protein
VLLKPFGFNNTDPSTASVVMRGYARPWAVAGGWAIDLFLGRQTRAHSDVDVATLRRDQVDLRHHLGGADVRAVHDGTFAPWNLGEHLAPPVHEIHARWPDGTTMEFLLNDVDEAGATWIYRRDPRVQRPLTDVISTRDDVPFLSPEVVLLYKSKNPGVKDDADFDAAIPHVDRNARQWLASAIALADPLHPWIEWCA